MHSLTGFIPELCGTHNVDCMYFMMKHYNYYKPNTIVPSDMARRNARHKKVKPAERTLTFSLSEGTHYIDIAQCLSLLNRASFRQGCQYAIESVELASSLDSTVTIQRISNSWPIVNAWVKGMALWKKQQDETMDEMGAEDTIAKYRDFKIAMEQHHSTAGFGSNLLPNNCPSLADIQVVSPTANAEWSQCEVVIPNDTTPGNTTEMPLHWVGADIPGANTSKSLVKAYAESRSRPQTPDPNIVDVALGGLFGEMFDVGDDSGDIVNNAQDRNHVPPYYIDVDTGEEFYPGGEGADIAGTGAMGMTDEYFLATNTTGRFVSSYGGPSIIPAGLLRLTVGGSAILKIVIAPGHYKGVMARPMQDVN